MDELKKILYVEDQVDIRLIAQVALQKIGGFEVNMCSGAVEALNAATNFQPDLFLLDVMMPGMDGPTLFTELKKIPALSHIPAIFMTAKLQPLEIENLLKLGAIHVIPKPFEPMTLADEIREIWLQHKGDA